jgi:hypothetical protein
MTTENSWWHCLMMYTLVNKYDFDFEFDFYFVHITVVYYINLFYVSEGFLFYKSLFSFSVRCFDAKKVHLKTRVI